MQVPQIIEDLLQAVGLSKKEPEPWREVAFNVLVVPLQDDERKEAAKSLVSVLSAHPQLNAAVYPKGFEYPDADVSRGQRIKILREKGREVLKETGADLVIFGHMNTPYMRLSFQSAVEPALGQGIFEIIDQLEIPVDIPESLKTLFIMCTLAAVVPESDEKFEAQKKLIAEMVGDMDTVLQESPPEMRPEALARTFLCFANICRLHAIRSDHIGYYQKAIRYSQEAIFRLEHDKNVTWASSQMHLGDTLLHVAYMEEADDKKPAPPKAPEGKKKEAVEKAERPEEKAAVEEEKKEENAGDNPEADQGAEQESPEDGNNTPEEYESQEDEPPGQRAVGAYREALKVLSFEDFPSEFARIQAKLGRAFYRLAYQKPESGESFFKHALSAFQDAGRVWRTESHPLRWADLQDNLGRVFYLWATREQKPPLLNQSVQCFRRALEVRQHDDNPLFSAHNKNNMAGSMLILGEEKEDLEMLKESRKLFLEAQEAFQDAGFRGLAHVCGRNVARADRALEPYNEELQREASAARMEAERAMQEELEARMEEMMEKEQKAKEAEEKEAEEKEAEKNT